MIICGLMSRGVTTASVGCLAENCTAESVNTKPSVIDLSRYIWALVCWKPMAGPPARTSILTPVSLPWVTSGPVTRFLSASSL